MFASALLALSLLTATHADEFPPLSDAELVLNTLEDRYGLATFNRVVSLCNQQGACTAEQFEVLRQNVRMLEQNDGVTEVLTQIKLWKDLFFPEKSSKSHKRITEMDPSASSDILCHALGVSLAQQNRKPEPMGFVRWFVSVFDLLIAYPGPGRQIAIAGVPASIQDGNLASVTPHYYYPSPTTLRDLHRDQVVFALARRSVGSHTISIVRVMESIKNTEYVYKVLDYRYPAHHGLTWNADFYRRDPSYAKGPGYKYVLTYEPTATKPNDGLRSLHAGHGKD